MSNGVRLDLLLSECVGEVVKRCVPNGQKIWDAGWRDVAAAKLTEMGVTSKPLTMVDMCRAAGILGRDPNVIEIVNGKRKKSA